MGSNEENRMGILNGCPRSPQSTSNETPHGGIVRLADIDGLSKNMLCSRCEKVAAPPKVAVCPEGHLICGPCVRILTPGPPAQAPCPKLVQVDNLVQPCGGRIGRYKCQVYEYLYNNSSFRCAYEDAGCRKTPLGSNVREHGKCCPYRPTKPCPFTSCTSGLVSQFTMLKHLISVHKISPLDSDTLRVQVVDERTNNHIPVHGQASHRWVCALLRCHDLNFMLMAEERKGGMYMWMSLAVGEGMVNGRKFQCVLSLVPAPDKAISSQGLTWEGEVYPLEESFERIVAEEDTLLIKKTSLEKKYLFVAEELFVWNADVCIKEALFQGISLTIGVDGSSNPTTPIVANHAEHVGSTSQDFYANGVVRFESAPSAPPNTLFMSPDSDKPVMFLDLTNEEESTKENISPKLPPRSPQVEVDRNKKPRIEIESAMAHPQTRQQARQQQQVYQQQQAQQQQQAEQLLQQQQYEQPKPQRRRRHRTNVDSDNAGEMEAVIILDNETTPEPMKMTERPKPDTPRPIENLFLPIVPSRTKQSTCTLSPKILFRDAGHAAKELEDLISRVDFSGGKH